MRDQHIHYSDVLDAADSNGYSPPLMGTVYVFTYDDGEPADADARQVEAIQSIRHHGGTAAPAVMPSFIRDELPLTPEQ